MSETVPKSFTTEMQIHPIEIIGQGGMGTVYRAEIHGVNEFVKQVALKTLLKEWTDNERFVDVLVQEAKLVSGLVHENIVQIHLLDSLPDGQKFFVMEYVEGVSLHKLIQRFSERKRAIRPGLAVHIVSRIARGLGYAHGFRDRQGGLLHIVHRDVCPSNILISLQGVSKLTDFGVAKARRVSVLGSDSRVGKATYMSPEQARGGNVDHRADIYGLGLVLYECVTGLPLRDPANTTVESVAHNKLQWHDIKDNVPRRLRPLLRRMLAHSPDDRFPSADALAICLEKLIYSKGYGPTIKTVENYLKRYVPELRTNTEKHLQISMRTTGVLPNKSVSQSA